MCHDFIFWLYGYNQREISRINLSVLLCIHLFCSKSHFIFFLPIQYAVKDGSTVKQAVTLFKFCVVTQMLQQISSLCQLPFEFVQHFLKVMLSAS